MADSNKPIVPGGDTVGTVGEVYLSKNGKTYECVAVIDNTTVTPNGETIPRVEYVWVCTDDGAGGEWWRSNYVTYQCDGDQSRYPTSHVHRR